MKVLKIFFATLRLLTKKDKKKTWKPSVFLKFHQLRERIWRLLKKKGRETGKKNWKLLSKARYLRKNFQYKTQTSWVFLVAYFFLSFSPLAHVWFSRRFAARSFWALRDDSSARLFAQVFARCCAEAVPPHTPGDTQRLIRVTVRVCWGLKSRYPAIWVTGFGCGGLDKAVPPGSPVWDGGRLPFQVQLFCQERLPRLPPDAGSALAVRSLQPFLLHSQEKHLRYSLPSPS